MSEKLFIGLDPTTLLTGDTARWNGSSWTRSSGATAFASGADGSIQISSAATLASSSSFTFDFATDTVYATNFNASNFVSAATYYGNGSNLTDIANGSTGYFQLNSGGSFSSNPYIYFDFVMSSVTFGSRTGNTGLASYVFGGQCEASGTVSIAKNSQTKALGDYSSSNNRYTIASGQSSFSGGEGFVNNEIIASGLAAFNHSYRENSTPDVSGATGDYSAIIGGKNNNTLVSGATILGCSTGIVSNTYSSIVGGIANRIIGDGFYNTIMGGNTGTIGGTKSENSSIVGGLTNIITSANYSSIIGGSYNTVVMNYNSAIVGGSYNTVSHNSSVVIGCSGVSTLCDCSVYVPKLFTSDYVSIGNGGVLTGLTSLGIYGSTSLNSTMALYSVNTITDNQPTISLVKGYGSDYNSITATQINHNLGSIVFTGFEDSGLTGLITSNVPAFITATAVENFSLSGHGTELSFSVTDIGNTGNKKAIKINNNASVNFYSGATFSGDVIPNADGLYSLGSPTNQWKELHVSGATIYLGGSPLSYDGTNLTISGSTVGGGLKDIKVSLTSDMIYSASTNFIDTGIPQPGANEAIVVTSACARLTTGTTAYDVGGQVSLFISGSSLDQFTTPLNFVNGTTHLFKIMSIVNQASSNISIIPNEKLYIKTDANPTTGDGTIDVYITYKIITL